VIRSKISCWGITNDLENRLGIELPSQFLALLLNLQKTSHNFILSILFSLTFISSINTQPVELPFENFSLDEGMPTVTNCILQDRTGYLWFATNSGLYKYDGYIFTSYKHDLDDTTSLIDNTLTTLYEDRESALWIGTWIGLEKFDRATNTFKHFKPNPSDTGNNASNIVRAICEDDFGTLWIGTENGLYKFNKVDEKFTYLQHNSADSGSISHNSVNTIYEDKNGLFWFGTKRGLDKLDYKSGKFIHYWMDKYENILSDLKYWIKSIFEDAAGTIWLGTKRGLVEFNSKEGTFFNHLFIPKDPINSITSICQDVVTGSLWLATTDGLFSFDTKSKKFTHYKLSGNCVLGERSGTLWVGTDTEVKKLNRTKQPFKKYPMNEIVSVVRPGKEGIVWVWSVDRFNKFDVRKEQFIQSSLSKDYAPYFIFSENELVVRTTKGGRYILDSLDNIKLLLTDSLKDFNNSLSFACKTKKGYWFGTYNGGLYLLDPQKNSLKEIRNLKLKINFIYEDRLGVLWISTFMGKVFCYYPEKDTLEEFSYDPNNPSSISGRHITEINEDTKGKLWFTTTSGLNSYDRLTKKFTRFTKKSGLAGNNIWGILEDSHGYLWISTNRGISKFDSHTNHFKNYDVSYGLEPTTDVFYGLGGKTRNGEMYFPGAKGFTRFHPDSIKDNPFVPPIVITSFKKFDKPTALSNEIRLPYDENFLSFEFAALSYLSNERNQYAYMMEGLDKDWVYSSTRRYASYPNLDPGEYIFRVKGSNNDGLWNEAGTSISIIISPPWWKTTWAYILYSVLILSIIYTTWKMQVKRIRISQEYKMTKFEAEKLHEVDELKSRFFANISHEFRTPLTLIMGPAKQLMEKSNDSESRLQLVLIRKNAKRLLELVNQLLDLSKLESGNMKLLTVSQNVILLIKAIVLSFTSYAERKKIDLKFITEEENIIAYIDKDKLEKIITNLMSNAFKFTPEGGRIEVTIKCQAELVSASLLKPEIPKPIQIPKQVRDDLQSVRNDQSQFVEISIRDTGVGIPKEKLPKIFDRFYQIDGSHTREQEGTGIGLSLTKELVELHKGTIEVESEEGKGTTFTISIPLGKEHLKPEEICEQSLSLRKESFGQTLSEGEGFLEETIFPAHLDSIVKSSQEELKTGKHDIDSITETSLSAGEACKPLLLIVEDNSDVRNYIRSNLNKDYRVLEAEDGEEGWNKSLEQIPDLIVSDVMMPRMDGFKLCEKLKSDERTSHIPVILLTAKAATLDKIEGYEIGADDYIMKPFETAELNARIHNLIKQRERLHEHFKKVGIIEFEEQKITSLDKKFLQKIFETINQNISDPMLGVELLIEKLAISRSVLYRKIISLTGEPPGELIRRLRLNKAAKLIEQKYGNLSEIALEVGFSNPARFSESFKKQFGISPSHYEQKNNKN
jgi:signal transduction histidine kinase/ligand-binding sensor domain-containing protein/CheY-like chemotaxis protein/AraC-like DNA-binding protein